MTSASNDVDPWSTDLDGPFFWAAKTDEWHDVLVRPDTLRFGQNEKKYNVLFIATHHDDYEEDEFVEQEIPFFMGKEFRTQLKQFKNMATVSFQYKRTKNGKINKGTIKDMEAL